MVKRLFPLVLILFLIPCMVLPASATTQDVVDALTNSSGQSWLQGVYNVLVDIRAQIKDTLTPIFEDIQARIQSINGKLSGTFDGESVSIGELMSKAVTGIQSMLAELDSIDSDLLAILQEIYTQGTLTIGECVKGIRSYIVQINEKLETGVDSTIGQLVNGIHSTVVLIKQEVSMVRTAILDLITGDKERAEEVVENVDNTKNELEEMESVLATSPSIDDSGVDSAISGTNGKFQNMTTDADGIVLFGALGEIGRSNVFSQLLPTSAMLGLLSFALFGRVF